MAVHYMLEPMLIPDNKTEEFNQFMDKHGTDSERSILNRIKKVKTNVDQKTIEKYINNLDLLSKTDGLVNENHLKRIERIKKILLSNPSAPPQEIDSQAFGASLLLWFLILVIIWRQPYYVPNRPCPGRPCVDEAKVKAKQCTRFTYNSKSKA